MNPIDSTPKRDKKKASVKLRYHVRAGKIKRGCRCFCCGSPAREGEVLIGHHTDYSKPLQVIWVCNTCHGELHTSDKEKKSPHRRSDNARQIVSNYKHYPLPAMSDDPSRVAGLLRDDAIDEHGCFAESPDLSGILSCMSSGEVKFSFLRWSRGMSLKGIGQIYGVTKEAIRQREVSLISKLRRRLNEDLFNDHTQ